MPPPPPPSSSDNEVAAALLPLGESADEAGTTHHTPHILPVIAEVEGGEGGESDDVDGTGNTRHESSLLAAHGEENAMEAMEEMIIAEDEDEDEAKKKAAAEAEEAAQQHAHNHKRRESEADLRLHRKVAELAARAYRRASERSNVLSTSSRALEGVAMVRMEELQIGKFLGNGSYSNVHEITRISCDGYGGRGGGDGDYDDEVDGDDDSWAESNSNKNNNNNNNMSGTIRTKTSAISVDNPRRLLAEHHHRNKSGTYRYAIKFLREELRSNPKKYAVGTADLVVEGMFLASLSHPNIVKVRGLPEGGVKSLVTGNREYGYFLVMDRLFDTLSDRIYGEWASTHLMKVRRKRKLFFFMKSKSKKDKDKAERDASLAVRLKVALDMAAALQFLHSKNIVYRDLKPENLGFDVRGDIKMFDFGLVKELRDDEKDKQGNYHLSMAGTPRYMAPECGLYQPYNLSADVYSFTMLLWEMLTLVKPLKGYTYTKLKNEIFILGERPPIQIVFNKRMRKLVEAGWSQDPRRRPSMLEVCEELKAELTRIAPEEAKRVSHQRRRSTYVARQIHAHSVRQLMRWNSVDTRDGRQPSGEVTGITRLS